MLIINCSRSSSFMLKVRCPPIPALCRKSGHLYFGGTGHLHFGPTPCVRVRDVMTTSPVVTQSHYHFPRLSLLVRQAKPGKGGRDVSVISETFRRGPAGNQPRPAEVGHQPEPSVAWWRSDPRCEAYTGSVQAA